MKRRSIRASIAIEDGVERAEEDGPPTAFRIWREGDNTTDHGPTFFTERSAALLLEQQARRGNRFSIDINHLSLDKEAPLANQRAVGFFDISVRSGELWAVNLEWTDTVRAGLAKKPPDWRYHSPAYDVDPNTGEVIGLTNLALTNNPATWGVTALATCGAKQKERSRMKWSDIKAALDGDDEDAKASAYAAIQAAFPDSEDEDKGEKKDSKAKKAGEDEPEKKDSKATKAGEDEPEKKDSKAGEDEPEKKDSIAASVLAPLDARLRKLEAENKALREKNEADERKSLIASHVVSDALAKVLATKPLSFVRETVATFPKRSELAGGMSTETIQATRGAGQGDGQASALPPDQKEKLDERMGIKPVRASIKREGVHQIFPVMTSAEARELAKKSDASKGGK